MCDYPTKLGPQVLAHRSRKDLSSKHRGLLNFKCPPPGKLASYVQMAYVAHERCRSGAETIAIQNISTPILFGGFSLGNPGSYAHLGHAAFDRYRWGAEATVFQNKSGPIDFSRIRLENPIRMCIWPICGLCAMPMGRRSDRSSLSMTAIKI